MVRDQWVSHDTDLNYAVRPGRVILRLIGAWPLSSGSSNLAKLGQRLINVLCYFLFLFILIPSGFQMLLREKSFAVKLKIMSPVLNCLFAILKYSILLFRASAIRNCLKEMQTDWKAVASLNDRDAMLSIVKSGRGLFFLLAVFMYGSGLSFRTIVPLSHGPILTPWNVTIRPLACPSYFLIFDEQVSPVYEIVFALQVLAGLLVYSVTCGVCGLSTFLAMHVCGQLRILMTRITSLVNDQDIDEDLAGERIAAIVEHQMKTKRFLKGIGGVTEYVCLLEILGCTSLVGLTAYSAIVEWKKSNATAMLTYIVLLFCLTFNIFIFCYISQMVSDESNNVYMTSSTINWYRLPIKKARCLVLIIAMSGNPMKLTAGKMIHMSLQTFTSFLNTSMGFFNILRTVI